MNKPVLFNVEQAADYMSVTVRQVRHMITDRKITNIKIGKHVRISQADIDSYIQANTRKARVINND